MDRSKITILTAAIAFSAFVPASAGVVHKWIDSDGITHYSDEIPLSVQTPVTQIELPDSTTATGNKISGEYSIANQWRRLHQYRIEREKLVLEKARQNAAQQQTREVVYVEQPRETRYLVTYPRSRYRQHGYYRSHHKYGRHYTHVNKKRNHGFHRTGMQHNRSSLGYFKHVQ
jgi:hypothetical protein